MDNTQDYHCSFCGKNKYQVKMFIAGTNNFICDSCVEKAHALMRQRATTTEEVTQEEMPVDEKLPTPAEIKAHLDLHVIGQDMAKITVAVAAYNHLKRLRSDRSEVTLEKSNVTLVGPSGSGKTLIAQSLAKFLKVPCVIADATSLTETGYVGEDVESIVGRLLAAANYEVEACEKGIIFLDEVDKLRAKSTGGNGRDVSGEGVQQGLLKLLEGSEIFVTPPGRKDKIRVNTDNILFIASGAFVGIDKLVDRDTNVIGFTGEKIKGQGVLRSEHLIEFGMIPEMIGRLPVLSVLEELTEDQLVQVLTEPKNSITKQYRHSFKMDGVDLEFTPEALRAIAKKSIENKTGARGLRNIIEEIMLMIQFELPDLQNQGVESIIINQDVIDNNTKPEKIYGNKQDKSI